MSQESSATMPLVFLSIYNRAQRKRVNILLLELTLLTLCMGCVATGKICLFAVLGCLLIAVVLVSLVLWSEVSHLRQMHLKLLELCRQSLPDADSRLTEEFE